MVLGGGREGEGAGTEGMALCQGLLSEGGALVVCFCLEGGAAPIEDEEGGDPVVEEGEETTFDIGPVAGGD